MVYAAAVKLYSVGGSITPVACDENATQGRSPESEQCLPPKRSHPVSFQLRPVQVLVNRPAVLNCKTVPTEDSGARGKTHPSQQVKASPRTQPRVCRGHHRGQHCGQLAVSAVDVVPPLRIETQRSVPVRGPRLRQPSGQPVAVAKRIVIVVFTQPDHRQRLRTPGEICRFAKIGHTGQQVVSPGAELHRVRQMLVHPCRGVILFINRTGRDTQPGIQVELVDAPLAERVQATQADIPKTVAAGGKFRTHRGDVVHFDVKVRQHQHDRQVITDTIHRTQHVHIHGHACWRNHKSFIKDRRTTHPVSAITVALHIHAHRPVGEHPVTLSMGMRPHDADWFVPEVHVIRRVMMRLQVSRMRQVIEYTEQDGNQGYHY